MIFRDRLGMQPRIQTTEMLPLGIQKLGAAFSVVTTCSARRCGKRSQLQRLHEIQAQAARGRSLSPADAAPAEPAQAVRSAPQREAAEWSSQDPAMPAGPFSFPSDPSCPRFPRPAPARVVAPRSEFLRHLRELEADLELAQSLKMRLPPALTQRIRRLPIRTGLLKEVAWDPEEAASASVTLDLPLPRSFDLKDRSSVQEAGISSMGLGLDLQMALEKEVRAPLRELQLVLEQVKARQDHLQRFLERADVQSAESRYPSPKVSGRRMPSPQPSRSFQPLDEALVDWPNGAETFAPFREQRCPRSGDKVASPGERPAPIRIPRLGFLSRLSDCPLWQPRAHCQWMSVGRLEARAHHEAGRCPSGRAETEASKRLGCTAAARP